MEYFKNKTNLLILAAILILTGVTVAYKTLQEPKIPVAANEIERIYNDLPPQAKNLYFQQSKELTKKVPERLIELDQLTIGCYGTDTIMQMSTDDSNLGGQCCGALKDVQSYELQLKALKIFIDTNENGTLIPEDPYDVPVEHAQNLIAFDSSIILSPEQKNIFDTAVENSHHGGPCCCKCWKWYMMSGLAKKLIVDYGWNADQIAQLWDLSSSCGHSEDTNMVQHYQDSKSH